jgi:hypothetical protein
MEKVNEYVGFRGCLNCDKKLLYYQTKYCSHSCRSEWVNKNRKLCLTCQKPLQDQRRTYCSHACRTKSKQTIIICETCHKEFEIRDAWAVRNRNIRFCSDVCSAKVNRVHKVDDSYFSTPLTPDKIITLGKIIVCGNIRSYNTLTLISDLATISDIRDRLSCDYKIRKTDRGFYRLEIVSSQLVCDLVGLGLEVNPMYQELPPYDWDLLWEGIKGTHVVNGWIFRSYRMACEVKDKLNLKGDIVSEYWRDIHKDWMFWEWRIID